MKEHIDFWWISDNGNEYGFDVKGVKKINVLIKLVMIK